MRATTKTAMAIFVPGAAVVALLAGLVLGSCEPEISDGLYSCVGSNADCPPGFHCVLRGGMSERRCYRSASPACGNQLLEQGEECDGASSVKDCRGLGFWFGEPGCRENCLHDDSTCLSFKSVSAGFRSACGLDSANRVWCWGNNRYGQLGRVTPGQVASANPVRANVFGPDVLFQSVAVGRYHVCGIDLDSRARCWGYSSFKKIQPLVSITANHGQRCGLDSAGVVWCVKDVVGESAWQKQSSDHRFKTLSVGATHLCGIEKTGSNTYCWGANAFGQLGTGEKSSSTTPALVKGGHRFRDVYSGAYFSCGVEAGSDAVYCWGLNREGQLGDGTLVNRRQPVPTRDDRGHALHVRQLSLGYRHACGLDRQNRLSCWGKWLGDSPAGASGETRRATRVELAYTLKTISAGRDFSCGTTERTIVCWGWNNTGQLGASRGQQNRTPRRVLGGVLFDSIAVGSYTTCGLERETGAVWCWGSNEVGQLGRSVTYHDSKVPIRLNRDPLIKVAAGGTHICGLSTDKRIVCWGGNHNGEIAKKINPNYGTRYSYLANQVGQRTFVDVAAGYQHSCGVDVDGGAWCWGSNRSGQLGDGESGDVTHVPKKAALPDSPSDVRLISITAGYYHTCGLDEDHRAWCWGRNDHGQLGNNSQTDSPAPVLVAPVAGETKRTEFSRLTAGAFQTCGIGLADSVTYCWGSNEWNEVDPDANETYFLSPHVVRDVDGTPLEGDLISAGRAFSCAVSAGTARCWGRNSDGQLSGAAQLSSNTVPISDPVVSLAAGAGNACAIDRRGRAWCWGDNSFAKLGTDTLVKEAVPLSEPVQ
jgi:alpha-tubulin suppressor-like RCC1 family protein